MTTRPYILDFVDQNDRLSLSDDSHRLHKELVWAAIIFIVAIAALCIDGFNSEVMAKFLSTGQGKLWVFISSIKTVYAILAIFYTSHLSKPFEHFHKSTRSTIVSLVIFVLIILPLFSPLGGISSFPSIAVKFSMLTAIAGIVAWRAMKGMLLIHAELKRLKGSIKDPSAIAAFIFLRSRLQALLLINGLIIGFSTLCTGAMRNAMMAMVGYEIVPKEYVIIYGFYFSGILAFAYFPTFIRSLEIGQRILEAHYPLKVMPLGLTTDGGEWYEQRQSLREILELDPSSSFNILRGFSIFSPIFGSAIAILLGLK